MKKDFFSEFGRGLRAYGPAFSMLFSKRFALFLLFPLVAWGLFFGLGVWLVERAGAPVGTWIQDGVTAWIGEVRWLQNAGAVVAFMFRLLLRVGYFLLFLTVGGYVVLVVLSPVFSWLSERTERAVSGTVYASDLGRFLRETGRGILVAVRNTCLQLLVSVLLFFFSFIPLVGMVSPVLLFLSSAYFYGFSFVDYTIERRYLTVGESVRYVNRNLGFVMGIGLPFAAALLLPFGRFLVCGYVSLAAVMAATVAVCGADRRTG